MPKIATGKKTAEVATMIGWNEEDPPQLLLTYILLRPVSALGLLGESQWSSTRSVLAGFFIPHLTVGMNLGQFPTQITLEATTFQHRLAGLKSKNRRSGAIYKNSASATLAKGFRPSVVGRRLRWDSNPRKTAHTAMYGVGSPAP